MRNSCLLVLVLALAAACGPSSKPAPADPGGGGEPTTDQPGEHPSGEHQPAEHPPGEHAALSPAIDAFHAVLSEVWHAEPGDARNQMACDAQFTALADGIDAEGAPAGVDAERWARLLDGVRTAINDLDGPCTGGTTAQGAMPVPDALDHIHDAFHALMEAVPAS